jgi:hypothetical protein
MKSAVITAYLQVRHLGSHLAITPTTHSYLFKTYINYQLTSVQSRQPCVAHDRTPDYLLISTAAAVIRD